MTKGLRLFAKLPALSPWEAPFSRRMPSTMMDFRRLPATATVETLPSLPFKTAAFSPIATQGNTHVKAMVNVDRICHGHSPALRAQQSIEDSEIKNPAFPEHGKNDAEQERLFNRPIRAKACFFSFAPHRAYISDFARRFPRRNHSASLSLARPRRIFGFTAARPLSSPGPAAAPCFPCAYGDIWEKHMHADKLLSTCIWEILQSHLKNPCG